MGLFDVFSHKEDQRYCPSCIEPFYPGDCEIISTVTTVSDPVSNTQVPKVLKKAPAQGSLEQMRARRNPEPLTGKLYTKELAQRKCPHCDYPLPYNIHSARPLTIAIVGENTSGKSIFISAMIKQIDEGKLVRSDQYTTFRCLTPDIKENYTDNYFRPLFEQKQILPPNQQAFETTHKPLIYELTLRADPQRPAKSVNLIIYDTSGEDYMVQERLVNYASYVLNANAIVYLADPVAMKEIAEYLPPHLQYKSAPARTPTEGLNSIMQLIERFHGKSAGSSLRSMPIAITLAKADLLKYVTPVSQQYTFMRPHTYKGGIDLKDLRNIDKEVRHLIGEYGEQTLVKAIPNSSRVSFFATSATGYPPDEDGNLPAVEPQRCLDPILWILHELRMIQADPTY